MNENMDRWLKSAGFSDNPFAFHEAGREKYLSRYFVSSPCFKEISGKPNAPESSIVFAPRGFGKTTQRIMLQHLCQTNAFNGHGRALVVSYTDFESLPIPKSPNDIIYATRSHVFEILHRAISRLTDDLLGNRHISYHFKQLSEIDQIYIRWFIYTFRNNLSLEQYATLTDKGIRPFELPLSDEGRSDLLKNKKFLAQHLKNIINRSTTEFLTYFVKKITLLGYDSLYILVDRLDEYALSPFHYEAFIRLIQPLFTQLALMDLPGIAFKFFLPGEWADDFFKKKLIREDRLQIHHVQWSYPLLEEILQKRLTAFNGPPALESLCQPDLAGRIKSEIIALAGGSPRNLIRLGSFLFSEHCKEEGKEGEKIGLRAWQNAQKCFQKILDCTSISRPECRENEKKGGDTFFPEC